MATLLLYLDGPLQSWGVGGRFTHRPTENQPTKSGIIGLLAAAQGRERTESIADLLGLKFGVRTDQRGSVLRDFQTEYSRDHGGSKPLTNRDYLQDYKYVAGVEGPDSLLEALEEALQAPAFPLFLGRRSCPPARRIAGGVLETQLSKALESAPWIAANWYKKKQPGTVLLPVSRDAEESEVADEMVRDIPVSFDQRNRSYRLRRVVRSWVSVRNEATQTSVLAHDPFSLLGGV